jgi:hypothetical protein
MKQLGHWLMMTMASAALLLCIATIAQWRRSYSARDLLSWSGDQSAQGHYIMVWAGVDSLRGGCDLWIRHNNASEKESIDDLKSHFDWFPHGFEFSSDPADAMDSFAHRRETYLFAPKSPAILGFQYFQRSGVFKSNEYWNVAVAMPFWFPMTIFGTPPLILAIRKVLIWRKKMAAFFANGRVLR